jgi:autotransporter-associated beta strand protein
LGISFFFANSSVWANGCSDDLVFNENPTAAQNIIAQLCSLTVGSSGVISTTGSQAFGINNIGTITTLNNNGSISASGLYSYGILIHGRATISTINNTSNGTISSFNAAIENDGTINELNNNGTISASNDVSILNFGIIRALNNTNTGTISNGIWNSGGTITALNNSATISSSGSAINNGGTITTLSNTGTISGGALVEDIYNGGTITTLNNKQGASDALRLAVYNPANYNIIIADRTDYGKLLYTNPSPGPFRTTFGISALSTTSSSIVNEPLDEVLTGMPADYLANTSGTSNGYTFVLTQTGPSTGIWNLLITACSVCLVSNISSGMTVPLALVGPSPVLSGGTLELLNGDSSSTAFSVTNPSTIQGPSSGSATLSGIFSGVGSLTFTGSGTTVLSGANTYSGGTTVSSGTLQGNASSLQGAIVNNSAVIFDQSSIGTYSGGMSGSGTLTKQNAGTLVLTGTNTYTGGTTVGAGTLQGNTASLQGAIVNNSQVVFDQATDGTYSGVMSGTGSLTKQNTGTLILTGANTYTGGTAVTAGSLQGNTTSLQGAIVNNSQVVFDQATAGTFSGVISGSGALTKQNAGTLVLTGTNTYTGGTTVASGTLQGNTTSLQGAIVNNSQVVFDQATDGTYSGAMSGTGSLTKQNTGTMILTGAHTYSGGTTVAAGTLQGDTASLQGAIVNNSQVVFDQAITGTFSGAMSGTGSLAKQNAGTLILTGANTYAGGTTVAAGTLQGDTTSLQGAIVNNGQLVFDQATDGTFSGAISGTGSLIKQNAGTLTLTGANTYSGVTTVLAGKLLGTTSLQGTIVNNSQVVFDQTTNGTYSGAMSGSGSLLLNGTGTVILTGANTYTGGTTVSAGTLQGDAVSLQGAIVNNSQVVFDQTTNGTYSGAMSGSGSLLLNGTGRVILTGANTYSGGTTVAAGTLQGNTTSLQGTIVNNSQVVFDQATAGTYSGAMAGTGSLTKQNAGTLILTGANTYAGGTTVSAGTLQGNTTSLQGAIVNNSQVVFDQATAGTFSGVISGSGALTKQNAGTLILTSANTYSGGTTVSAGTLQINTSSLQGAIVNNSQVVFDQATAGTFSGTMSGSGALTKQNVGTLVLTGTNTHSGGTTVAAGTLQGNTTSLQGAIVNNSQVVFDQATNGTYSGAMSGTGSLTKQDAGTLILTGANTYTGGTTIAAGTLHGNSTSLRGAIVNNGQLVFDQATDGTFSGVISGTGSLIKQNAGTLTLTGANTYSGATIILAGKLLGTTSLQGSIVNNSQVVFDQSTNSTYSGAMSGSGSLLLNGTGTVVLTGANTYTGGTTVAAGTLQGDTTSLQGSITNNGTVVFDQPSAGTFSGTIAGSGSVVVQNAGTLVLSGANTYSGGTTVIGGTLSISGQSPTGTGAVVIGSGATLMGRGEIAGRLTVAGVLKPGNSPGYLSTNATLTMNTGSIYQQDIAGTTQASSTSPVGASGYYSYLNVTNGQFVIQTGATLTPRLFNLFTADQSGYGSATYVPALGDRFRMATAQSGISGRFSTLTQPAELSSGTQLMPFYNMMGSNSLDLAVIPSSYVNTITAASGNANAQSVGSVLTQSAQNSLAGQATEAQEQLLYSISPLTNAQSIVSVAQSLAGEVYAATVAVIAQTTQRVQQTVLSRLGDSAGSGLNMPAANLNSALSLGGAPSAAVSSNPNVNPNAEVKTLSNGNVWGDLAYQRGNRASDSQSGGWNSNLYQLTFGSDFYSSNGTTLGGGFALSSTTINPVYGSATVQQGSLFAYGKMPVDTFVVDAMASIGLSSSDITRGDITGLSNSFKNKTVMGNDALISLGLSRPMDLESVRLTPYARVTWQIATQSAVNEGEAASALNVDRYTGNGVRGVIGVAAGSLNKDPLKEGYTYRANIGVGADTTGLLNPNLNTTLVGYTGNVTTPNAGAAFVQAGLYGTAKIAENAFAYAGVSAEARSGQTLYGGSVGLRIAF